MVVFGVRVQRSRHFRRYIEGVDLRFKDNNPVSNPFDNCFARYINSDIDYDYFAISMKPKWFAFYLIGYVLIFATWYLRGFSFTFSWLYVVGLVFASLGFFWSKWFYFLMLKLGSRKAGYEGGMLLISKSDIIGRLIAKENNINEIICTA